MMMQLKARMARTRVTRQTWMRWSHHLAAALLLVAAVLVMVAEIVVLMRVVVVVVHVVAVLVVAAGAAVAGLVMSHALEGESPLLASALSLARVDGQEAVIVVGSVEGGELVRVVVAGDAADELGHGSEVAKRVEAAINSTELVDGCG